MDKIVLPDDVKKILLARIREHMELAKCRADWASDLYEDEDQAHSWWGEYNAFYQVYSWIDEATSPQEPLSDEAWHEIQNRFESVAAVRPTTIFHRIVRITDSQCPICGGGDDEEYFEEIDTDADGKPTVWRCRHCGEVMYGNREKK